MSVLASYFKTLTAAKKDRNAALRFILAQPNTINLLFQLAFDPAAKRENIYAAWVWELFILDDVNRFSSFINECLPNLPKIENSSMRRSLSKSFWYYLKVKEHFDSLGSNQKKMIISIFLDWIITENKTAPLSFSIKIIALFKVDFPEVQNQLKDILLNANRIFPKGLYPTFRTVFKN